MSDFTDKIMVELDCLLDTRIGILSTVRKDVADAVVVDNKYHERTSDRFSQLYPGFDDGEFYAAYATRTYADIAGRVFQTHVVGHLINHCVECRRVAETTPEAQSIKISVNVFPYQLTETQSHELLDTLQEVFDLAAVELCSYPCHSLTPGVIKGLFTHCIMYDFDKWANMHYEALMPSPMPSVNFIVPAIAVNDDNAEAVRTGYAGKAVRYAFAGHIAVDVLPLKSFSFMA